MSQEYYFVNKELDSLQCMDSIMNASTYIPCVDNNSQIGVKTGDIHNFSICLQTTPFDTADDGSGAAHNNEIGANGHANGEDHGAPDSNHNKWIQPEENRSKHNKTNQQRHLQKDQGSIFQFSVTNLPSNFNVAVGEVHRNEDMGTRQLELAGSSSSLFKTGDPDLFMNPATMGINLHRSTRLQRKHGYTAKNQSIRDRDTAMGLRIFNLDSSSSLELRPADLYEPGPINTGFQEIDTELNNTEHIAIRDSLSSLDIPDNTTSVSTEVSKDNKEQMRSMDLDRARVGRRKMFDPG